MGPEMALSFNLELLSLFIRHNSLFDEHERKVNEFQNEGSLSVLSCAQFSMFFLFFGISFVSTPFVALHSVEFHHLSLLCLESILRKHLPDHRMKNTRNRNSNIESHSSDHARKMEQNYIVPQRRAFSTIMRERSGTPSENNVLMVAFRSLKQFVIGF